MKIRYFLRILLFTTMFAIYQTFSYFLVTVFYSRWFFNGILSHRELIGLAMLIAILSGGVATAFKTQLRLALYGGNESTDRYVNKSTVYSQILVPYIFLIMGLIVNLIFK